MLARKGQIELDTTQVAIVASRPAASWTCHDKAIAHDALQYLLIWWKQRAEGIRQQKKHKTKRAKER